MNKFVAAVGLSCSLLLAAGVASAKSAQNDKMTQCNAEATGKHLVGPERKSFMRTCLSARPAAAGAQGKHLNAQQQRMVTCNASAKTKALKGDARKTFMRECLHGKK